jgi:hypothetical protein
MQRNLLLHEVEISVIFRAFLPAEISSGRAEDRDKPPALSVYGQAW